MNILKTAILGSLAAVSVTAFTGCGTVNTVMRGDDVAARNLNEIGTHCESIPRVYSGVAYDLCRLHGAPAPIHTWQATDGEAHMLVVDLVVSGVLDTLSLPYTIFKQSEQGNIRIK
ncbi:MULTISPECIES: YceK/YidQ family lipoprotein [unclassified Hahella]|uniref:YceK/YidQ family lipoprotein n=1 Tax=unclassified Hahella TaxID=2624107 RepID=UPI000FDE36B6|nr:MULTISPECIES: YceK/YidQ family lipoprotein [unclassified Hahella]AZZ90310.1 YceK/YidQ family lipoprotein [Hahella sp. KA22]MBU6951434.1 YceK/YidQ family lipoprotein [Hahella sp. HN01]MDG9669007.1 YceK/YidQ family lipoprotein [Hahella sp. CR1]QAY53681.1 YceK/YidQ family lipoprotein [Hahella sp. KA22]